MGFYFCEVTVWSHSQRQKAVVGGQELGEEGKVAFVFHGYGLSVWEDKNVLEMGGGGFMTMECIYCH